VAMNLRISRGFGIGPKIASGNSQDNGGGPPPGGPPPGGGPGGGGRGGGGGFGPGGFGMGGGGPRGLGGGSGGTGRKYSLTFSAQALNLFNDVDYGQPMGTLIPTKNSATGQYGPGDKFGRSTSLTGGIFSQGSAVRRVFVQAVFSF